MIRLVSAPTPDAVQRLDTCFRQMRDAEDHGETPSEGIRNCYRHQQVKTSIIQETSGKCAYCESKISHVYWGDVEHIRPKSHFPELSLNYDNLTLACAICNNKKGEYWMEEAPILNPYTDEPENHLVGLGPFIWQSNGSEVGQRTITLLDLNRNNLHERRLECIKRLDALANRYAREPNGPIRAALGRELRQEVESHSEYALIARSFLRATHNIDWELL